MLRILLSSLSSWRKGELTIQLSLVSKLIIVMEFAGNAENICLSRASCNILERTFVGLEIKSPGQYLYFVGCPVRARTVESHLTGARARVSLVLTCLLQMLQSSYVLRVRAIVKIGR